QIAAAPVVADRRRGSAGVWTRRVWAMEMRLRRLLKRRPAPEPVTKAQIFAPGDILFLPGEHDRHDFALLLELKRAHRVRLAFLFYDLLRVLDDGDPRLRDPHVTDLPQTDFMVREA